jgi:hypothetical protein
MAIVVRRYAFVAPSNVNLAKYVGASAALDAAFIPAPVAELQIDNAVADAEIALDEYMGSLGWEYAPTAPSVQGDLYSMLLGSPLVADLGAGDFSVEHTYAADLLTLEAWKRTDATLIYTLAYTYALDKIATEVAKVFATDGTTIVAQGTRSYSYTGGGLLDVVTFTRDV